MIARCGVTAENGMLTAGLSSLQHQILPASSKGVLHEFCTLLLVHLCNTLPALAMLMIARWASQPRDSMLTAGL
jgi:uncharacterized protein (DUF2384 family)